MIQNFLLPCKIPFTRGHFYLQNRQLAEIKGILDSENSQEVVAIYEKKMASLIGAGHGVSFATGRMAFFSLLRILGIAEGDEVILPAFTCSVMVNAVWKSGATPIFSDIDCETFGSSAKEIEKKITPRTKLIVAQHSFGIPCDIVEIAKLARKRGIFLAEDCAITLDSSVDGVKVGNWGDAAIFSTDHTKPLNTLVGGFFYTKEKSLYGKIREYWKSLPELDNDHQKRLYEQLLFEARNYTPVRYPRAKFLDRISTAGKRLAGKRVNVFFEADYGRRSGSNAYPYPAKMPSFLAKAGSIELDRWSEEKRRRKDLLRGYVKIMKRSALNAHLPKAYTDFKFDITPLRFVFQCEGSKEMAKKMSRSIDTNQFWFRQPVICASGGLEGLGYKAGSCPVSESVGSRIINWPCIVPEGWDSELLGLFEKIASGKNENADKMEKAPLCHLTKS